MSHYAKPTRKFFHPAYNVEIEIALCDAPGPPFVAEFSHFIATRISVESGSKAVALSNVNFIECASTQIGKAGPELYPDKSRVPIAMVETLHTFI
jgi:hypothetical protein